jgi:HD-like signal output (HDOD) protein
MSTLLPLADATRTIELLQKRIRERGDMPGFTKAIRAIVGAMHGESEHEFNMTNTVLSDPVLTQKVLRLANSPMYAVFGQGINTVTKAVIVLGTEAIGHVALGLKLVESLNKATPDSALAREEMGKAVLAGEIARQLASSAGTRDAEEAVVGSMLHGLGRMLASFYLPEYWSQVLDAMDGGADESEQVLKVFGLHLTDLGRQTAQRWGLPGSLLSSMQVVAPRPVQEPLDHAEWLAAMSTLSYRSAQAVWDAAQASEAPAELLDLASNYADMLGMESTDLMAAIDVARVSVRENAAADSAESVKVEKRKPRLPPPRDPALAAQILARGVADMRDVSASVNSTQLMTMGLEAIHQGLTLQKSVVFLRNSARHEYRGRIYLGSGLQEILPQLALNDAYEPDVFHAALATGKMVFVASAQEPLFLSRLPRWWRQSFPQVNSFIVLPLLVERQAVGFIYGDWGAAQSVPQLDAGELAPLNELLELMIAGIEQRRRANS